MCLHANVHTGFHPGYETSQMRLLPADDCSCSARGARDFLCLPLPPRLQLLEVALLLEAVQVEDTRVAAIAATFLVGRCGRRGGGGVLIYVGVKSRHDITPLLKAAPRPFPSFSFVFPL